MSYVQELAQKKELDTKISDQKNIMQSLSFMMPKTKGIAIA
ncbi:hypothetical protein LLB_2751 [Legionella longbeachae D-4968]|nr:hypothetical protein LLB_2751 [Legionella longbeachae D-4968]